MENEATVRPSLAELKRVCRKGDSDPIWISNIFWRPVSIYVSWLAVRLGVTANAVTTLSAVFALAASIVLLFPSPQNYVLSAVLLQVFFFLDHVDGEVSRYRVHSGKTSERDQSGRYFDLLVHYFQGPSFYFCLGAGLWSGTAELVWVVAGVIGAIGSSGFPRFVALYELFRLLLARSDAAARQYAEQVGAFYVAYLGSNKQPKRVHLIPGSLSEFIYAAKWTVGWPGHLFAFATIAVLSAVTPAPLFWPKLYLATYSSILGVNTVYVTWLYLRLLAEVPEPSDRVSETQEECAPSA